MGTDKKKSAEEGKEEKKVVAKKTTTKKTAETKEKTEAKTEKAVEEKAETPAKETVKKAAPVAKKKEEVKPLENFDRDRIGMYDETLKTIGNEEVIEGTIVSKTNRDVVVNIGFKSEGVISISEFRYNPDLKEGDKVEVFVVNQEDKNGQLILSHSRAR